MTSIYMILLEISLPNLIDISSFLGTESGYLTQKDTFYCKICHSFAISSIQLFEATLVTSNSNNQNICKEEKYKSKSPPVLWQIYLFTFQLRPDSSVG